MAVLILFVVHWQLSVFCQTFFLHRYGAHKQFTMSKGWERFFHLLTYITQGSSFLDPRGYAILHRMHHAYSDTPKDPHSPVQGLNIARMMWKTKLEYDNFSYKRVDPEPRFEGGYPEWPFIDKLAQNWVARITWIFIWAGIYYAIAPSPWWLLLLPFQLLIGVMQGATVNWCGHKYGYRNFDNGDASRNTLLFDFVTLGELFQNNHHKFPMSPNFAARWFEVDPTYLVIRVFAWLGIIDITGAQKIRYPAEQNAPAE